MSRLSTDLGAICMESWYPVEDGNFAQFYSQYEYDL